MNPGGLLIAIACQDSLDFSYFDVMDKYSQEILFVPLGLINYAYARFSKCIKPCCLLLYLGMGMRIIKFSTPALYKLQLDGLFMGSFPLLAVPLSAF